MLSIERWRKRKEKYTYHLSHSGSLAMEVGQLATWHNWGKKIQRKSCKTPIYHKKKREMKAWPRNLGKEYSSFL